MASGNGLRPQIARIGDYMIEGQLGAGGMGVVYKARQISMHRTVALKVLRDNLASDQVYMQRFFHEVRLLASMEHPNMVRVFEAGKDRGSIFFSMEYVEGDDLKNCLDRRKRFTEKKAADIGARIAAALAYAWNKERLVHRDIKPANIMLLPDGSAKILDLGISKKLGNSGDMLLTNSGVMVGSPTYMSPEQARADQNVDFRTDIYSLGVSLFQILAGEPPYAGKNAVAVVTQHLSAPIPDVRMYRPDVSGKFARMIRRMMAKEPADRYGSWEEVEAEMKAIAARPKRRLRLPYFGTLVRSVRFKIAIILLLLVMLVVLGVAFFAGNDTARQRKNAVPAAEMMTGLEPDRKEAYRTLRAQYLRIFDKQCTEYWSEDQYEKGLKYCEDPNLPQEFQKDGLFAEEYRADVMLQDKINSQKEAFRKRLDAQKSALQ